MRIVQITDLHIVADPLTTVLNVDTHWALEKVLASIMGADQTPDLIVATGDLVDDGRPASYQRLRNTLLTLGIPVYVLPGNHDSPKCFSTELAGGPIHSEFVRIFDSWGLVFLDSHVAGEDYGAIGTDQMARASECLAANPDTPFLVALHHTPIAPCQYPGCKLQDGPELIAMLRNHPNAKLVASGHAHVEAYETHGELHLYTSPATSALAIHSAESETDDFYATHSFELDRRGYRVFDLLPNGGFSSHAVWV